MEQSVEERLRHVEEKLDAIYTSTEKARRYTLIHLIIAFVVFAIPLLGLLIAIPALLDAFSHMTIVMP